MLEENKKTNYQKAKEEADKIDLQIINVLQRGKNFRVEAGAGSGKTYSLNKVIEWIQDHKWAEYNRKNQKVVCITYTNTAVDVIAERLSNDSFILPSTIHSFAWNAIKQYQSFLINYILANNHMLPKEGDFSSIRQVQYNLGHRYIENGILYLFHDDVIVLFSEMLDNVKFRNIFANKYPLILIDEYQDSFRTIVDKFIKYFIDKEIGPQFGFFGDAWQTIYQSNKACGLIENKNIVEIKKVSNFRSSEKIVNLLNNIRPELPQVSAKDDFEGEVIVITCDDYNGARRNDRNFKGDIPTEELKHRLNSLVECIKKNHIPEKENIKVLENVENMSQIMHECDIAISAGGSTLYELAALSLPAICFKIAENQNSAAFWGKEAMIYAGDAAADISAVISNAKTALKELIKNPSKANELAAKAHEITDGKGAKRIAAEILAL